jgi:hypothetical protein
VSTRGHGGHGRPGSSPQFLWMLPVIVAALIGGLAAAALVHASLAIAVAVSVVVGAIAIFAAYRWPGPTASRSAAEHLASPPNPGNLASRSTPGTFGPSAPENPASPPNPGNLTSPANPASLANTMPPTPLTARPEPATPASPARHASRARPPAPPATSSDPVVQLLPASPGGPGGADAPWWDAAQGGPPAPSHAARRAPAPDLSSYLSSTVIAQCPNCGAFRLDFRRAGNGWDFRCESCRYTWSWQAGTNWPPVRVAPRRRSELHGDERQRQCMRETSADGTRAAWSSCSTGLIR